MYMYVCCHLKGQGKNGNYMKPPNISTKSRSLWQSELPMLTNVGGQHTVDQLHICVGPMPLRAARDAKKMTSEIDMKQKDEELLSLVYVPSGSMILYNMIISLVLQCSDHMTTSRLLYTLINSWSFFVRWVGTADATNLEKCFFYMHSFRCKSSMNVACAFLCTSRSVQSQTS